MLHADDAPVPMSGPDISDSEIGAVMGVLHSGCLSIGPQIEAFEQHVRRLAGARHAVAVSSGTAGLHLAVIAAGIDAGDLVITTSFSFVASANCVLYERAIPVFVDVDPVTGNIDPELVAVAARDLQAGGAARERWLPPAARNNACRTGPLKGILAVHAFGHPADMDPIADVAAAHGVPLIEDACEAVGAEYRGRPAGALGDVGVFAFYPNKQVTTGEGGMIVTDHDEFAALFRSLRNQGRGAMNGWLEHDRLGYNYRMDELSAALGAAQFARLSDLLARRDRVAAAYTERLASAAGITTPIVLDGTRMSWFAYVVRLDPQVDRLAVIADLADRGVPTRPYFTPIHLQPFYMAQFGYGRGDFPITEALGDTCLALPFSGTMSDAQIDRVVNELSAAVLRHGRGRTRDLTRTA
jgi:dTDP-4-amino-4,6-dideoxygalactose transaminase